MSASASVSIGSGTEVASSVARTLMDENMNNPATNNKRVLFFILFSPFSENIFIIVALL